MQFTTQLPVYYLVLCAALAGVFTWLLYRGNDFTETTTRQRPWWLWLITTFRFLVLFIVSALLLEPLLKAFQRHIEKPVVAIVLDGSESVLANKDSAFYRTQLTQKLQEAGEKLGVDYEVNYFTFGHGVQEGLNTSFNEKQTNLGSLLDELYNRFDKQNLGAVILATDGIYNEGSSPLPVLAKLKAPVIALALGDTNLQKDLRINNVRHNDLAYLGNSFPLLIESECVFARNEKISLSITHRGKTVFQQTLQPDADRKFYSTPAMFEATGTGVQHYIVQLSRIKNEISYNNNRFDVFVEVLDGRQKVLLLAQQTHPDIGAIKSTLENNPHYEVNVVMLEDAQNINVEPYSLAILHQLPGGNNFQGVYEKLINKRTPLLFITGAQTNYQQLQQTGVEYTITGFRNLMNDAQANVNPTFNLFTADESLIKSIGSFPPLKVPFGNYVSRGENEVWLKQQIGNVVTEMPLISFRKNSDIRSATIWGEGMWRWRLSDYQQRNNHEAFDALWSKLVQYLAVKDDKRNFRVNSTKKNFFENDRITFEAELYNKSYELITEPDVQIQLQNSEGKKYNYSFSKTGSSYRLDAGLLPAGTYSWTAQVNYNGKTEKVNGSFTITPLVVELLNTRANHQLLGDMANESKGLLLYPDELDKAIAFIQNNETIKPVVYRQQEIMDLIHLKWVFVFLLLLLTVEWGIRKYRGGY